MSISRWEERAALVSGVVSLPVPVHEFINCLPSVAVDGGGTADFAAFDDGFLKEEIGDGGSVLVNIADGEAEEFGDASASTYAEHE